MRVVGKNTEDDMNIWDVGGQVKLAESKRSDRLKDRDTLTEYLNSKVFRRARRC